MGGVERAASEACDFWFDVERRQDYWIGADMAAVAARAGSSGEGLTPLGGTGQAERVRMWADATAEGATAGVLTRERIACLASMWKGGDAAALRRAAGRVLRACLAAVPRERRPRRVRRR